MRYQVFLGQTAIARLADLPAAKRACDNITCRAYVFDLAAQMIVYRNYGSVLERDPYGRPLVRMAGGAR